MGEHLNKWEWSKGNRFTLNLKPWTLWVQENWTPLPGTFFFCISTKMTASTKGSRAAAITLMIKKKKIHSFLSGRVFLSGSRIISVCAPLRQTQVSLNQRERKGCKVVILLRSLSQNQSAHHKKKGPWDREVDTYKWVPMYTEPFHDKLQLPLLSTQAGALGFCQRDKRSFYWGGQFPRFICVYIFDRSEANFPKLWQFGRGGIHSFS